MACNDDWQTEGRRVISSLQHSHPITAYTRIADEVAESFLKDNNEASFQGCYGIISFEIVDIITVEIIIM